MALSFETPNMSLIIPVPLEQIGPDWASNYNESLTIIDQHDHSLGSGVPIATSGININADLSFNDLYNLVDPRSVRLFQNAALLSGTSDRACLYSTNAFGDLYYNDGSGNQIRLTASGSIVGTAGSISGLPSCTAGVAYTSGNGTFLFEQSTGVAANIDVSTVVIRYSGTPPSISGDYIALEAPSSLSSGYALTLPALPASQSFLEISTSGVISPGASTSNGITGSNIAAGTITGTNIALQTITGSNILNGTIGSGQIAAGTILGTNIANSTITGSNIAANTITYSNVVVRVVGSTATLGQMAVSSNSGISSTSSATPNGIPNQVVHLTTQGSPVQVKMIPTGNAAFIEFVDGAVFIQILRDSGIVNVSEFSSTANVRVGSSIDFIDFVGAGSHEYQMVYYTDGTAICTIANYITVAWELT